MFDFIGAKIRLVAKVQCWIGIIASVIVGFKVMLSDDGGTAFLIGLLILVFGTLFSYVGSFLLYGFGQLVDNSDEIVAQMHRAARREEDEFQIVNSGCAQPQAPYRRTIPFSRRNTANFAIKRERWSSAWSKTKWARGTEKLVRRVCGRRGFRRQTNNTFCNIHIKIYEWAV